MKLKNTLFLLSQINRITLPGNVQLLTRTHFAAYRLVYKIFNRFRNLRTNSGYDGS